VIPWRSGCPRPACPARILLEVDDVDADGEADWTRTHKYDSSEEIVYEYDDSDRLVRMTRTDLLDPSTVEERYEDSEAGQLTTVSTNWNTDSDPVRIERLTYDDDGRILRKEAREETGALSFAEAYDYGLDADPIRRSQDFTGDGAWDWVTTWTACE
jgi:hypothetical protein